MASGKWKNHENNPNDSLVDMMKELLISMGEREYTSEERGRYTYEEIKYIIKSPTFPKIKNSVSGSSFDPYYKASFSRLTYVVSIFDLVDSNEPLNVYEEIGIGPLIKFSRVKKMASYELPIFRVNVSQ